MRSMMRRLALEISTIRRVSGPAGDLMGAATAVLFVAGALAAFG